jgi:hypothetical protein
MSQNELLTRQQLGDAIDHLVDTQTLCRKSAPIAGCLQALNTSVIAAARLLQQAAAAPPVQLTTAEVALQHAVPETGPW